jgi:hypothetical protein
MGLLNRISPCYTILLLPMLLQAKNQVHGACRERLIREIMRVDRIDWDTAYQKVRLGREPASQVR